ncbi:unnamed protein product [Colias eurytheme]|nr:unnamed protein product [Colias eurytheme]
MAKLSLTLCVVIIAATFILPTCDGFRGRGFGRGSSKYDANPSPKQGAPMAAGGGYGPGQGPSPSPAKRGLGISAWGLITVIISIILAMAGMYYFSICYPVMCKKSRKYDMIGLANAV